MPETTPPVPLTLASRVDQVFPILTSEQIARLAMHGQVRHVQRGEVLMEAGEQTRGFSSSPRVTSRSSGSQASQRNSWPPCDRGSLRARSPCSRGAVGSSAYVPESLAQ